MPSEKGLFWLLWKTFRKFSVSYITLHSFFTVDNGGENTQFYTEKIQNNYCT